MKQRSTRFRAPRSRSWHCPVVSRACFSRASWNRMRSSAAALRVNVTAARVSIRQLPSRSRAIIRSIRHVVLPVPAAASTKSVRSRSVAICWRASWSARSVFLLATTQLPEVLQLLQFWTCQEAVAVARDPIDVATDRLVNAECAVVLLVGRGKRTLRDRSAEFLDDGQPGDQTPGVPLNTESVGANCRKEKTKAGNHGVGI